MQGACVSSITLTQTPVTANLCASVASRKYPARFGCIEGVQFSDAIQTVLPRAFSFQSRPSLLITPQEAHNKEQELKQKVNQQDSVNRALLEEREQLTKNLAEEREKRTAYEKHILVRCPLISF
eukprot:SAG31_NODE_2892_length_4944_cov_1.454902_1_plen_124_part_00